MLTSAILLLSVGSRSKWYSFRVKIVLKSYTASVLISLSVTKQFALVAVDFSDWKLLEHISLNFALKLCCFILENKTISKLNPLCAILRLFVSLWSCSFFSFVSEYTPNGYSAKRSIVPPQHFKRCPSDIPASRSWSEWVKLSVWCSLRNFRTLVLNV